MADQFNRKYELTIIPVNTTQGFRIQGLRVEFDINKSVKTELNDGLFSIYNVRPEILAALRTRYAKIQFEAGYERSVRRIFFGEVVSVDEDFTGIDHIVNIKASTAAREWQNVYINRTYGNGVPVGSIVNDLIRFTGLDRGFITDLSGIPPNVRGMVVSGSVKQVFKDLGNQYGFDFTIDDGVINIVADTETLTQTTVPILSRRTGLYRAPSVDTNGEISVVTPLNNLILAGGAVKIESVGEAKPNRVKTDNIYKVIHVNHSGSTFSSEWQSTTIGVQI